MDEKIVGILGGMGPEATLSLFSKIIDNTPAGRDQDHLRVLIDSNAKVPDRTKAILHGGPSPVPLMAQSSQALARAGADFIVIPCVTAHHFLDEIRHESSVPIVSILDVTADHVSETHAQIETVGLLATSGTNHVRLFHDRLDRIGVHVVVPEPSDQAVVMDAIYAIKGHSSDLSGIALRVAAVAERLIGAGAQGIIAGCTEIPAVLRPGDLAVPVFDTLLLLARAAIRFAGREPRGLATTLAAG